MRDALLSAEENRAMFDRIARRYDLMNTILSLGHHARWRRRAVRRMKPRAGGQYLDVGCGTADVAIEILRQCPDCQVVGIDPAERMLDIGRRKLAALGLSGRVRLQTGDAVRLPIESDTFDAAIAAFCLRNVTDRAEALAEMGRVVRPGGPVAIIELTRPRKRLLRLGHRIYTRAFAPLLGAIVARDRGAYRYLVDSVMDFPAPDAVLEMMTRANLANCRETPMTGGAVTVFLAEAR
jgi:demethylmenaquinone methyltransferase/2-methoxy-6-polyprenyl-1,4-benzoquinol methylase